MKPINKYSTLLVLLVLVVFLTGCQGDRKKYVIGVSQCSEDSWRTKLVSELKQSTYFNEDVELKILSADDNVDVQIRQIEELVNDKVDLLIVSPQQTKSLSGAIRKATEKHIPVIMFDRKSDVQDYTAFMGADNYAIGKMLGEYVATCLNGKGCIVEIAGERGSSPAIERHKGFNDVIGKYPGLRIVGYGEGDWKQASGEKCMEQILASYHGPIDCVFGANDRITLGARSAIERYNQTHKSTVSSMLSPIYIGVDALPTPGGGIEKVRDGVLDASAIYPTHGDELMNLALSILRGDNYQKNNTLETSLVTSDNAKVMLLQHKEVVNQDNYIRKMHSRVDKVLETLTMQRIFLWLIVLVVIITCMMLAISVRGYRTKQRLNEVLQQKNEEINQEKEIVERQRDELEQERDKLIEARLQNEGAEEGNTEEPLMQERSFKEENQFLTRFKEVLDERMSDSDLSVEEIGEAMNLSRTQLYRKIKALTGTSPVDLIRQRRLEKARSLLHDSSLSVSEVGYRVGFSSPSYFTKCYKDYFGKAPTEESRS